jgi:dihydroorotate dehydrogenase (fumarate)
MKMLIEFKKKRINIEVNLSCPNVEYEPICYNLIKFDEWLQCISKLYPSFGIKLSPFLSMNYIYQIAGIIKKYPQIRYIVCSNTLPNGLILNSKNYNPVISNKYGGLGGNYLKPISLANVNLFYKINKKINNNIDIIGCGGINSGKDVYEYIIAGASAVQIATHLIENDLKCFKQITKELSEILSTNKITINNSIHNLKGKL